ncbi:hypothetical protein ACFL3V_03100 [Nanoarchaeota archaeon]
MGGKAVSSVHIVSNPIVTIARLLYAHSSIIDHEAIRPHGVKKKTIDFLVEQALERQEDPRFTGSMEKYKLYMDGHSKNTTLLGGGMLENLRILVGRPFMFLGFENRVLEDRYGRVGKSGVDDFSTQTEFVKHLLHDIYRRARNHEKEGLRSVVWYRMGVYDFPFVIEEVVENGMNKVRIRNPFSDIADVVGDILVKGGKTGLGDQVRYVGDTSRQGNYRFSDTAFSGERFTKRCRSIPGYLENLHHAYEKKHGAVPIEDFEKLCKVAIRINKEIIRQKYSCIIDALDLDELTCYMLQGDFSRELLTKIREDVRVPGIKLLQDTSNMPDRGVLEAQALNRLSGWVVARFKQDGQRIKPIIVPRRKYKHQPAYGHAIQMPAIRTLGTAKQIDDGLKGMDHESLDILKKEIKTKRFYISSIEVILVRLNNQNFVVETELGQTQWQDILAGRTVHPLPVQDMRRRTRALADSYTRPSNAGNKCELHRYISMYPPERWDGMGDSDASKAGIAIHTIANELLTKQHMELPKYGIRSVPRDRYCEVPIAHEFRPSEEEWDAAESEIILGLDKTDSEFYSEMLRILVGMREEGTVIVDGGSPDGVAIIDEGQEPVIIDFKRRVASMEQVKYFSAQTSRYAMAVMQGKGIEAEHFYTAIVQTPYTPAPFLGLEMDVEGLLREQVIRIRQVRVDGDFLRQVRQGLILEHVGNITLHEDPDLGRELVKIYMQRSKHNRPSCHECFANNAKYGSYQCRYLLEDKKELWDGTQVEEEPGNVAAVSDVKKK